MSKIYLISVTSLFSCLNEYFFVIEYIYFFKTGFSTYYRMCSNCGLKYRYQEWTDGLHNFDDHLLMSLHMCIILRHSLQVCFY